MNGTLILDSNAIIDLLDGSVKVSTIRETVSRILLPAVGTTRRDARARELIEKLLAKPAVAILPVSRGTADFYASVYTFLQSRGTPIPVNDVWIAAAALETGGTICTKDRHLLGLPLIQARSY